MKGKEMNYFLGKDRKNMAFAFAISWHFPLPKLNALINYNSKCQNSESTQHFFCCFAALYYNVN